MQLDRSRDEPAVPALNVVVRLRLRRAWFSNRNKPAANLEGPDRTPTVLVRCPLPVAPCLFMKGHSLPSPLGR